MGDLIWTGQGDRIPSLPAIHATGDEPRMWGFLGASTYGQGMASLSSSSIPKPFSAGLLLTLHPQPGSIPDTWPCWDLLFSPSSHSSFYNPNFPQLSLYLLHTNTWIRGKCRISGKMLISLECAISVWSSLQFAIVVGIVFSLLPLRFSSSKCSSLLSLLKGKQKKCCIIQIWTCHFLKLQMKYP